MPNEPRAAVPPQPSVLSEIHSPFCPTCGVTAGCKQHGHEFPDEADVPLELRRELLKCASSRGISYYWLTAIYRQGRLDAVATASKRDAWIKASLDEIAKALGEGA